MKWIDINLDQPQADTEVIVCVDDDVFLSVFRHENGGDYFDCEVKMSIEKGLILNGENVTHWMPLPEPFNHD